MERAAKTARNAGRKRSARPALTPELRVQIGERRRAQTREKILAAAFKLLGCENGRSVRPDEICQEAGISRGSFYNHFSNMDELISSLSHKISHRYNVAVHDAVAQLPSIADRSAVAVLCYLHRAKVDPPWGWAMVNLSVPGPIFGAETFARASASVALGFASGDFKIASTTAARDMMLGTALATMQAILRGEDISPEVVMRQILGGLGASEQTIERSLSHPLPVIEGERIGGLEGFRAEGSQIKKA